MKTIRFVPVPAKHDAVTVAAPTNHILVIDCSGSMCYDLPKIRTQLKNKLPAMVKENDTVSLVWFSGRGEFGRLVDRVRVQNVTDLERLNTAIDRWLKPIGCTGFVEPLKSVSDLIHSGNDGEVYSMMFLTDGYDNQWSHSEILDAVQELEPVVTGAVFVEYGWYCNHNLLEKMASTIGGSVVFAEDFDSYDPIFDGVIKKSYKSFKKIEIEVGDPLFDLVFTPTDSGAITYKVENGKVRVPEGTSGVYFFSEKESADDDSENTFQAAYQGLAVLSLQRKGQFIKEFLKERKNYPLYNRFANCFGKQNLYDFHDLLIKYANETVDFSKEEDHFEVDENGVTVLDFLGMLQSNECKIDLKSMSYNRIGKATEHKSKLSEEEKKELCEAIENAQSSEEVMSAIDKVASMKKEIKFIYDSYDTKISSITWNETRPNVSMLFRLTGNAIIGNNSYNLPESFPTFIWRNYTIIRDGILNIEMLPIKIYSEDFFWHLVRDGFIDKKLSYEEGKTYEIDLRHKPLINEKMVQEVSAQRFVDMIYEINQQKASKKVFLAELEKIHGKDRAETFREIYGDEAAEYLLKIGITDGGFSPIVQVVPATDKYMATELIVKIKGMSSIPSYNAVMKKITEGKKINAADELLINAMNLCEANKKGRDQETYVNWLFAQEIAADENVRYLSKKLAEMRFSVIVGQVWFKEFDSIENCVLKTKINDKEVECTFELKDTTIAI